LSATKNDMSPDEKDRPIYGGPLDPRGNEDNPADDNSLCESDGGRRRLMKPPSRFTSVVAARLDLFEFPGNLSRIIRVFVHSSNDNFTKIFCTAMYHVIFDEKKLYIRYCLFLLFNFNITYADCPRTGIISDFII